MSNASLIFLAGAAGALVAALVNAVANIILTVINRRSEERKQINELVMNAALTDYKLVSEQAERENARTGRPVAVLPLDAFLVHNFLLVSALTGGRYKTEKLKERLLEVDKLYEEILAARKY